MRVLALLLTDSVVTQYLLHSGPGDCIGQGFVSSVVGSFAVGDDPFVVRIDQELVDAAAADGSSGGAGIWTGGQAACVEFFGQCRDGPIAGGVRLEGPCDEGASYGIDFHGANLGTVGVELRNIQIADGCHTGGAASLGFLVHALENFHGEVAAVERTDRTHNVVQQHAARCFIDIFGGRNEFCSSLFDRETNFYIVGAASGQSVHFVYDDVVNVVVFEVAQHLL
nr:hypothetical protein [Mycobacteroides abscessus]